jgi:GST-like protein
MEYPINRFAMETKRQMDVLDQRLAQSQFIGGASYSIADIAIWPWYGGLALGQLYDAAEFLQVQDYRHVQRWATEIAQRPAVLRGRMVNRAFGPLESQLHERHAASDFDTQTQDKRASS